MFRRTFAFIVTSMLALPALALSPSDAGVYAVVSKDGNVTSKHIRLVQLTNGWRAEDADATGPSEECPSCLLLPSSPTDIEHLLGGPPPKGMSAECEQNQLMAICRVTDGRDGNATQQFGFIALTQSKPVYLKLVRVPDIPRKP